MNYNPYECFKHGLTVSKLWLCEELEPHLPNNAIVAILGSWYNLLGFMMLTRNNKIYESIVGIDSDPDVIPIADKICEGYMIGLNAKLRNVLADVNTFNLQGYNVIINTSLEHMSDSEWFEKITHGSLVCLQSSDMPYTDHPWYVTNPIDSLETLLQKYRLKKLLYTGIKEINYNDWGYKRFMAIGIR